MFRRDFLFSVTALSLPLSAYCLAQSQISDLESIVYTALINHATDTLKQDEIGPLVVSSGTASLKKTMGATLTESKSGLADSIAKRIPEATKAVVDDLVRHGDVPGIVRIRTSGLRRGLKVRVVSATEIEAMIGQGDRNGSIKKFKDKYGTTNILHFSRVGWDSQTGQALIAVANVCGALCGSGSLVLLQRRRGVWRILKDQIVWVS